MRRGKIAVIILMVLTFTGCMKQYDVPEDKGDAISEYMAGVLLQGDSGYKDKLLSEEVLGIETPDDGNHGEEDADITPSITPTPSVTTMPSDHSGEDIKNGSKGSSDQEGQQYNLTQVIGVKDFNISYVSKKLVNQYPESANSLDFSLEPRTGDEFLVITFKVENPLNTQRGFNLMQRNIEYHLTDDEGTNYLPLFTLLVNDMQYIDVTVSGNQSETGVLIFELPHNKKLTKSMLTVSNGSKKVTIELK